MASALPAGAAAEQASESGSLAAERLDAGGYHSCAVLVAGGVRCWGFNGDGQLGYANPDSVGDDETPGSVGPVNFVAGRTAKAIAAGDSHTCAVLDDASVRCWGFGGDGRLGYANTTNIRDPSSVGPVDLGLGRTATAISAGGGHTCAILDNGTVRCWGYGFSGQLGYANRDSIGDNEPPGSVGPVDLGSGHTAKAISAGARHTCAILDDDTVRCWGNAGSGRLGYPSPDNNLDNVGDDETPGSVGAVDLGPGRTATAISAGDAHTCALLDNGRVRCWGYGLDGQLGYANQNNVGDFQAPGSVGPVDLGPGRIAMAISAGARYTCALLDNGRVSCWGYGVHGQLGYGNQSNVGDRQTPGSVGPVDLGPGRTAKAISAGARHTCAALDDGSLRCWGYGGSGRLGYCNETNVGDRQAPGSAGPVNLEPGDGGAGCISPPSSATTSATGGAHSTTGTTAPAPSADAIRARGLRSCLAAAAAHARRGTARAQRGSPQQRAHARRDLIRHASRGRRRCLRLYARIPGRITGLRGRTLSDSKLELSFKAPGTDGTHPPPARSYLIKQALRPIRTIRDFARAQTLCKGHCRFTVLTVGAKLSLTVTDLHPHTTYYYALAARDNVSARPGPRSQTVTAKTQ